MINLLVELLIGRFTIIIVGTVRASGNGRAGSGVVFPVPLLAYSKTPCVQSLFSYHCSIRALGVPYAPSCAHTRRPEKPGRGKQSACATWTAAFCYLRQ